MTGKEFDMMQKLIMTPIARYQRELAAKAIAGSTKALELIAKNHGCLTWLGTVDKAEAMRTAQRIVEGKIV